MAQSFKVERVITPLEKEGKRGGVGRKEEEEEEGRVYEEKERETYIKEAEPRERRGGKER